MTGPMWVVHRQPGSSTPRPIVCIPTRVRLPTPWSKGRASSGSPRFLRWIWLIAGDRAVGAEIRQRTGADRPA